MKRIAVVLGIVAAVGVAPSIASAGNVAQVSKAQVVNAQVVAQRVVAQRANVERAKARQAEVQRAHASRVSPLLRLLRR